MNTYKYIFGLGVYQLYRKNAYLFKKEKEPIHIIGNGWATYHFVKNLDKSKFIPIVISPNEYPLNTTKLIKQIDCPDKDKIYLNNDRSIIKLNNTVKLIDPVNKIIHMEKNNFYRYKNLVIAIGSEVHDFGIDGVNLYTTKIKKLEDIDGLRKKLVNLKSKSIYVIGGGPTGVELVSKLKNLGYDPILIEGMGNILTGFNIQTQKEITKYLENKKIDIKFNEKVIQIEKNKIKTSNNSYPYDLAIWVGGVKFNGYKKTELYKSLDSIAKITPRGIEVDSNFKIHDSIYCIGDIVSNKGPPTAQNAKYQAKWLANYFNNPKSDSKYEVKELGKIIHLENKIYLESKFYSGYLCKYLENIIDFFYRL